MCAEMGGFAFWVCYQVFSSLISPDKKKKQKQTQQTKTATPPPKKNPNQTSF